MKPLYKPELEHLVGKIKADLNSKQDKLTAGENVVIANNTISATDTVYDDTAVQAELGKKADKTYVDNKVKTDVPLNAKFTDTIVDISGKADINYVDNKVKTDVPLGAKFTDTVYSHPSSHPASMITESSTKRFVSDTQISEWDGKETTTGSQDKANQAEQNAKDYADSELASFEGMSIHGNDYHTENYATELDLNAHKAEKATQNEYGHIRLQDIPNPEIATQIEAEAGTNNTKMMTPLRVEQAIASNVKVSGVTVEIYIDNEWVSFRRPIDISSWGNVQEIVRNGWANDYFQIGDQLVSSYDGRAIVWQVIGIDVDTPIDSNFTHSMTIQTKDCVEDGVWDSANDNRYINSDIRAYLNSSFLNKLDPELSAVIGLVNKKVAVRDAIGGQDSFSDKVFLLSQKEVDLGDHGVTTGEFIYPYYNGKGNANRIKNLDGSAMEWWFRSPHVSSSNTVRLVYTSGSLGSNNVRGSKGVSPACVII